ncbi:MAG: hypothetical protein MUD03_13750 [Pirellula sp.]|jgi:hypothetical protein|nr:hypothetical protein [Pirellula sp.]
MLKSISRSLVFTTALFLAPFCSGREWKDASGLVKIQGTLLAADDHEVVIKLDQKRKEHELLAVPLENLSKEDLEYLKSKEVADQLAADGQKQVWELANGMKVYGRLVRFVEKDVSLQRRRGRLYVNDRPIENLPEVYQKMIPNIVGHFEKKTFADHQAFDRWVAAQKSNVRTFHCEGVMVEFPNGDEYALPLFFLSPSAAKVLQPSYEQWKSERQQQRAEEQEVESQRQNDLYLQSQAMAMQQQQQEMMKIAKLQLLMTSVAAGVTDMWEVYLYPPNGMFGYPISVVVPARNSADASAIALQRNPGFVLGPVRRISGF